MNRKQFVTLMVLVVVLGAAGLMVYQRQNESRGGTDASVGKKVLADFAFNEVGQITIQHGSNEVNLVKKEDLWRVQERDGFPANFQQISDFLLKWRDLKVVQGEEVGPSQLARLWLVPGTTSNSAVVVDFKDQGGKAMKRLLLGKKHMRKSNRPSPMGDLGDEGWPDGRYVMVGTNTRTVALISDALSDIEPKPEQWLKKDFFRIEKPRSIAVTFPTNATNSWRLTREGETTEWKLSDPQGEEKLDTSKVSGVQNPFSSPSFNDVAPAGNLALFGLDQPTVIAVDTFEEFSYTVKVGQKTNDTFPVLLAVEGRLATERTPGKDEKPEDKEKLDKEFKEKLKKSQEKLAQEKALENHVFLVSSWTVDSLLKERKQLMAEKKEEKANGTSEPDKDGAEEPGSGDPDSGSGDEKDQ